MRAFTIEAADAGRRLDRYVLKVMPAAGAVQVQMLIRRKEVKLNGRPAKADARLAAGDLLTVYAPDALFEKIRRADPFLSKFRPRIRVAYEDDNLLIVDKRPGMVVHPDEKEKVDTLVNHARAYLYQKGAYDPESGFAPAPCNRIDRFTGGLVIVAKNRAALLEMDRHIRNREVAKDYLLAVLGVMRPETGQLVHYMVSDGKRMRVLDGPSPGAKEAVCQYRTLWREGALSLVRCRLLTGRTHQIRAQFARAGHPLAGDNQYGDPRRAAGPELHYQALYAYRLRFDFSDGLLGYLGGKSVACRDVPFVAALFPGFRMEAAYEAD